MKKKNSKLNNLLNSKKTTVVLLIVILTPFVIFGGILLRDKLQTGTPIVGSRNNNQLEFKITEDQIKEVNDILEQDIIINHKVNLKASTLRIYAEVSEVVSWEEIEKLGTEIYDAVNEILPIETYFTNSETNKQYDLEIHVYNDVEDTDSESFYYYEIIKNGSMSEPSYEFVTDARDPEFKKEVLEIRDAKEAAKAEKDAEDAEDEGESGEE